MAKSSKSKNEARPARSARPRSAQVKPPGGQGRSRGTGRRAQQSRAEPGVELPADAHLVPGERAVAELLSADASRVQRIFVARGRDFSALLAGDARLPEPEVVERAQLDALVGPGAARGIVVVARPPRAWTLEELLERDLPEGARSLLVLLDGVSDPQNLGAILRSAEFFGVSGVLWTRHRSAKMGVAAIRASAGASERLPTGEVTNLARALEQCRDQGWWVLGSVVDEGRDLDTFVASGVPDRCVLVLGSEGSGLRRLTRDRCDELVTIAGRGQLGSLNVSSAAAVALARLTTPQ